LLWSPSAPGSGMSALADFSGGAEGLAKAAARTGGLGVPEPSSAQAISAESSGTDAGAAVTTGGLGSADASCGGVAAGAAGGCVAGDAVAGAGTGG
jgi:hypothetical protein